MAGYITKLQGYVYDGVHLSSEPLTNGVFVEITSAGVAKVTAAQDTVLRVEEKTTLWGLPALVLDVVSVGLNEVYYVENDWGVNDDVEWDEAKNTLPVGKHVRMKRLLPGEQVIMSVDDVLYATLSVGNIVRPAAGGSIAV